MHDSEQNTEVVAQRLCSEIQLFDLCNLDSCRQKSGRFCTDIALLSRFEKIAENEPERYISEDTDDEAGDGGGYDEDDEFAADELDGDEDGASEEE